MPPTQVVPYLGLWKVKSIQSNAAGYPNVSVGSLVCLVWSDVSSSVRCLHGSNYVLDDWAVPRSWAQTHFQFVAASGMDPDHLLGTVDGIPVWFRFNGTVFTCDVDPNAAPSGSW